MKKSTQKKLAKNAALLLLKKTTAIAFDAGHITTRRKTQ
jgi:hypothetical protein